jgi:predicted dehydrogenase
MNKFNRRSFLKSSLLAASAVGWTARSWSQVAGANERINAATVGFNGRGGNHISGMTELAPEGVKYVALCDVDQKVLDKGIAQFAKKEQKVDGYRDMRKLLERKDLDVVTIATPNHWHALAAIWAIQAGKDVYVEKPVSHNVWEGRKIVEAARKYNRIVQTGTQSRSSTGIKQGVEWVLKGGLGKILCAYGTCYKPRQSIGLTRSEHKVPDNIDYDLWSGPAPLVPTTRNNPKFGPVHYDWHWFWNYGNGDLGNQGIHQMDIARWFLGVDHLAPRVFSVGGRVGYQDDAETPNTQIVFHDYDAAPLIFEVRGLPKDKAAQGADWGKGMDSFKGSVVGVVIDCEGGYVTVPNYTGATAYDKDGKKVQEWKGSVDHYANFIEAVKSRKHTHLNADIWEGHLSSALCHTGNISYRLGQKATPGEIKDAYKGNARALDAFERMADHLKRNEVDINSDKLTLGPLLTMDPKTEKFFGNKEADALLTREYRAPFVVPERV